MNHEIDLSAIEISDLVHEVEQGEDTFSQVMAASCVGTACTCSSTSSST
ncbi:thiocillin/thiostrepton family thiazolyl peptide [Nocardiopsis alba]|jgi:thiazolylpeptide-type bacteriocin precursor|uniref:Thiocillin/thiostrepton family thiazolyl peptide n=2 Tax=Nocardiopsis TaxID=2013 RepID=A0ABV5DZ30_9ACTN|nr:thiocillin/thiostrepton family thiazolyl peptide [Nocardiopsis alba]ADO67780.1 TpaX [Nocardiopsis sp. TFS65-07]